MTELKHSNDTTAGYTLLPCPFCGGIPEMLDWQDRNSTYDRDWSISCFDCGVEMPSKPNEKEAIEAWNTRHFNSQEKQ